MSEDIKESDWKHLFPVYYYERGGFKLPITPLNLTQIALIKSVYEQVIPTLIENNIDFNNLEDPAHIPFILDMVVKYVPDLVSNVLPITADDLMEMPLELSMDIVRRVIEVNLESKDGLLKNFQALVSAIEAIQESGGQAT